MVGIDILGLHKNILQMRLCSEGRSTGQMANWVPWEGWRKRDNWVSGKKRGCRGEEAGTGDGDRPAHGPNFVMEWGLVNGL